MGNYGVISYFEASSELTVELQTQVENGFVKMRTNPIFLANVELLKGRALTKGERSIALYLNGELANNSFGILAGEGYITFEYTGSIEFLKTQFLFEVKLF